VNYGSYWQAKCLALGIQGMGCEVEILDHRSAILDRAEWRVALRPTLPEMPHMGDSSLYKQKVRRFACATDGLPLSREFDLDHLVGLSDFDVVVVGSDEVWNLRHPWFAGIPAFFGAGLPTERVIAYAASFGNYSCWEGVGSPYRDLLGAFDALSVRDENSWWMLKNALGIETPIVLDPCLQFPDQLVGSGLSADYALVYGHNFSSPFVEQVCHWARLSGHRLISIGYRNDWAHEQRLQDGPLEFASAVNRASCVITNFFHGCVFAFANRKPLACEASCYRSIKIRGLLELLGAEDHLVEGWLSHGRMDDLLTQLPSEKVMATIDLKRLESAQYLTAALGLS
jgi:hypothetical protein